eukprot:scaffold11827_cov144-Amphora_coffeaeformis.AAC.1
MRWTAPSADVSRFKSLHGHSVLRPPYKSCATSLNCATYQWACVAELQGQIYNQPSSSMGKKHGNSRADGSTPKASLREFKTG